MTLNGSGSSEPLGCPLALHWAGTCATATGASPTVTCPLGTNTETLTVTDNGVILSPESNVQITVTRFAINPTPSGATVSRGRAATYALSIGPLYGAFTNAVSLACSNLPAGTACSFSPRSVTPGSAGATSMLTLSTTAPAAVFNVPFGLPPAYGLGIAFMTLCLLSLMVLQRPARRRLATLGLAAGLFIFILTLQVACGAGSTAPTNPGTSAGTYTVIFTGTSGSLANSVPVTLTVQ